jgi:hypothetical protein
MRVSGGIESHLCVCSAVPALVVLGSVCPETDVSASASPQRLPSQNTAVNRSSCPPAEPLAAPPARLPASYLFGWCYRQLVSVTCVTLRCDREVLKNE